MNNSISVVLPVYNGSKYLRDAISSILKETRLNIEIVIINDGSTDNSDAIIKEVADDRVIYIAQLNCGLAATLNKAIALSSSDLIARMDQDDIMMPGRLMRQFDFMHKNSDIAMVGTWSTIIKNDQPTMRSHTHVTSDKAIKLELLFDNPFVHSSMMIRKNVLDSVGGYCEDKSRQPPEDYELWSRVSRSYKVANIPEKLMVYREVETSMSRTGVNPFLEKVVKISSENLYFWLSENFTLDKCYQLACLYHGFNMHQFAEAWLLSRKEALIMHRAAALKILSNSEKWDGEFMKVFERQVKQIRSRFVYSYIPSCFISYLRLLKHKFRNGGLI